MDFDHPWWILTTHSTPDEFWPYLMDSDLLWWILTTSDGFWPPLTLLMNSDHCRWIYLEGGYTCRWIYLEGCWFITGLRLRLLPFMTLVITETQTKWLRLLQKTKRSATPPTLITSLRWLRFANYKKPWKCQKKLLDFCISRLKRKMYAYMTHQHFSSLHITLIGILRLKMLYVTNYVFT